MISCDYTSTSELRISVFITNIFSIFVTEYYRVYNVNIAITPSIWKLCFSKALLYHIFLTKG